MKKMYSLLKPKNLILLLVMAFVVLLPQMLSPSSYITTTFILCFIYGAMASAWNIVGGYGGQISWCHAAFVAIGAYTGMIFYNLLGISPLLTMPLGMLISYIVATLIGRASFKLRGPFFSIATMAFSETLRVIIQYWDTYTGGASGIYVTYKGANYWNLQFENDRPFYYVSLVVLLIIVTAVNYFAKSKTGYYLRAISGDEDAAVSLGIDTRKVKVLSFQISAMLSSIVGMVFGFYLSYVEPASICGLDLSIKIGVVAILGGAGTVWGPVLGAFVLVPLTNLSSALLGQYGGTLLLYGVSLILIVLFRPSGLISFFEGDTKLKVIKNFQAARRKRREGAETL